MAGENKFVVAATGETVGMLAAAATSGLPGLLGPIAGALYSSVAGQHHQAAVQKTLIRIRTDLEMLTKQLETLSEPQLQLVNDIVRTVVATTNEDKQEYLANAVANCVEHGHYSDYEATFLSDLIRTISADEILLLRQGVQKKGFLAASRRGPGQDDYVVIIVSDLQDYDQIENLTNKRLLKQDLDEGVRSKNMTVFKPTRWALKLLGLLGALGEGDAEQREV